jgi:hypothetical protein
VNTEKDRLAEARRLTERGRECLRQADACPNKVAKWHYAAVAASYMRLAEQEEQLAEIEKTLLNGKS